jgi:ATP-dependent helicase/nuclease subunit A
MSTTTKAQERAITQSGNVLVVAGAGTGKTRTLVKRCVRLLLEHRCGLDRILMVTFTEAAAAEMRKRIREELRQLQQSETDAERAEYLRNQLLLLDAAYIGTLHSFCLQLVRRHTHQLGIDPAVAVLDKQQTAPLMSQVLDGMLRRHYANETGSADVHNLIRQVGGGNDRAIRSLILRIHHHSQSLADPNGWLAGQEQDYSDSKPAVWQKSFEAAFKAWRNEWLPEVNELEYLPAFQRLASASNPEEAIKALGPIVAGDDEEGADELRNKRLKSFWKDVKFFRGYYDSSQGDILLEEWQAARGHVLTLLRLTREFTEAYAAVKRQMGGVDFADLEQLALRLLRAPSGRITAVAKQWRERFDFIFVDECQDINRAQDSIIEAISRDGEQANRFLVGDVKQSIFRFRRADPSIFTEYDAKWRGKQGGERIPLSDNFRSRESILDFVNALFSALMRPSVGGVAYGSDARLRFGNPSEREQFSARKDPAPRVELHLINPAEENEGRPRRPAEPRDDGDDEEGGGDLQELTKTEREARLAATLLRDLRASGHAVWDEEEERMRPVEWRDMAVLLRSAAGRVESYAKEFDRFGIPLLAARSGLFEAIEVRDLLNLLRILDNPIQDVPVLAVLRSPLAAFSLEELVAIRHKSPKEHFWYALRAYHRSAQPSSRGWTKVDALLKQYNRWRILARQSSITDCLQAILAETHYEAFLLAGLRGEERVANVHRLLGLARRYDPWQRQGLYRFLKFVDAQEEEDVDHAPASSQGENAVRLMTIHGSKGLEFPVVLLGELGTRFNMRDLSANVLIQDRYGICPKIWPPGAVQNYQGLAHWMGSRAEKRELLGEEMRLLYVALTRARDTLLLTGTSPRRTRVGRGVPAEPRLTEDGSPYLLGRVITDREVISGRSYLDWFLKWLPAVTDTSSSDIEGRNALLRWRIIDASDPSLKADALAQPAESGCNADTLVRSPSRNAEDAASESVISALEKRLAWKYPHAEATREPAVKRVSEVIWNAADPAEEQQLAKPKLQLRPARRRSGGLTAAEVGNAHHLYLQTLPLDTTLSDAALQKHAHQLLADRVLTKEEVAVLDLGSIKAFWVSPVGKQILARTGAIQREIPFTARFSAQDLAVAGVCPNVAELAGEFFVARGAVDLAVLLPKEIWILDFKTDQLAADELADKTLVYGRQLQLYALALGRIYRRPVTRRWLHFLSSAATVEV